MKRERPEGQDAEGREVRHDARGMRIGIAVSRFNHEVTARLLAGAKACLDRHGSDPSQRTVVHVPGAWELQLAAQRLAATGRYDAIIALGALIRGETPHFDVLAHQVARGLGRVSLDASLPVIFGVLTTENVEQALARSEDGPANKGFEAALAAIEMVDVVRDLGD
jgi:6,7-dimethyl-8-ribityllumazine synthase